jgi:hypothetical protein
MRLSHFICIGTAMLLTGSPAAAQEPKESYVARLSARDHHNAQGTRLRSAAAILRQDRANYHRYGVRDAEDQGDGFFAVARNRDNFVQLLQRARLSARVENAIVNGTPLVRVDIHEGWVTVTLVQR